MLLSRGCRSGGLGGRVMRISPLNTRMNDEINGVEAAFTPAIIYPFIALYYILRYVLFPPPKPEPTIPTKDARAVHDGKYSWMTEEERRFLLRRKR